jgi:hypothetical protein
MSRPDLLNGNGDVAGIAYRYSNTEFEQGISTWFYSGGQTTPIGFRDAEHTSSTGWQQSRVYFLNEAGQVVGDSERYNASGGQRQYPVALRSRHVSSVGLYDG